MAITVRLTNPQALQLLELIGRTECADRRTLEALRVNGHHLGTMRRAAYRLAIPLATGEAGPLTRRLFALERMTLDGDEVEVIPPKRRRKP